MTVCGLNILHIHRPSEVKPKRSKVESVLIFGSWPVHINQIFTARIRRMGEGNIFTLCVNPHFDLEGGGGVPHPRSGLGGWYQIPGLDRGGTPSQVWPGGVPHPRSGLWGVPLSRTGWGTPPSGLDGVTLSARTGYPPKDWTGYPPLGQDWMGYPPLDRAA